MRHLRWLFLGWISTVSLSAQTPADSVIFSQYLEYATNLQLGKRSPGERVAATGLFFLNTPYVAHTLEAPGPERLRVNLREMDCNTFVENVLALSLLVDAGKTDWATFKANLETLRYRNSTAKEGYTARLHYASDWLNSNAVKGFLDVVRVPGKSRAFTPKVFYMSQHPEAYAALKAQPSWVPLIAQREKELSDFVFEWFPKRLIGESSAFLQPGDVVLISTSIPGLDFSHMGFVLRQHGKAYLLHASSAVGKVTVTELPLNKYLAGIKNDTGIVLARPW
jgi:hypothetical protein